MATRIWKAIAWVVPVITFVYGMGTYWPVWDTVSGRRALQAAYDRLHSPNGYPTAFVFAGEPEFPALLRWARDHATGPDFKANLRQGVLPTCFTARGGSELRTPMPQGDPLFIFVPESSPILALHKYTRERRNNAKAC